jgi:hypothetical protein
MSRRKSSLVVSLSNREQIGSSFRLRQGCGLPKRNARRMVDRLRTSE